MDQSKDGTVSKNRTVTKWTNQKTALLLKIEDGTVTKWTNQKAALLLKIESDTVTKNNGPIRRDLKESQLYKKE